MDSGIEDDFLAEHVYTREPNNLLTDPSIFKINSKLFGK